MASCADVGCVLKVNIHCEACRMHLLQVLKSISGVYSVTIDAEEGLAKISGEVDPNVLLRAVSNNRKHAELKWVNLNRPSPNHYAGSSYYNNDVVDGYYGHGWGYGSHIGYGPMSQYSYNRGYGPMNQSYHRGRELLMPAEGMYWEGQQNYLPQRWPQVTDHEYYNYPSSSYYSSNYGYPPPSGAHYR